MSLIVTNKKCRQIIVFGENKKEKQSYQYNKRKQRLFTLPFRITDVNSDIVVIDCTSNDDGRVVVLGKEGGVKWIYHEHPQINTEDRPFDPHDIVTTSVGNAIVADGINDAVHVISVEGEQLLTNERNGFICPDFVKSLTSEPPSIERRMSLVSVLAMSYTLTWISVIVLI
jgi:hypothetical protein